jgi:hypothetical protein
MTSGTHTRAAWPQKPAWAAVIGGSLAVAAASLLVVRAVSYDAWGWLIWGREILGRLPFATNGYPTWIPSEAMDANPMPPHESPGRVLWHF